MFTFNWKIKKKSIHFQRESKGGRTSFQAGKPLKSLFLTRKKRECSLPTGELRKDSFPHGELKQFSALLQVPSSNLTVIVQLMSNLLICLNF